MAPLANSSIIEVASSSTVEMALSFVRDINATRLPFWSRVAAMAKSNAHYIRQFYTA